MTHTSANGETPSTDEQVSFRLVSIHGIPYWQASTGRTFPVVAGAEDPPPDGANSDDGDDDADDTAFDKDRALATIRKQREREKAQAAELKAARAESAALKARQQEADNAQLSETERLRNRTAELERAAADKDRELQDTRTRHAIERAAAKAGATDPEDVFRLLDTDAFEVDDKGQVTNADDLVKALLKTKPYLAGKGNANGVPPTPRSNGSASHEDRVKENREKLRASGDYEHL